MPGASVARRDLVGRTLLRTRMATESLPHRRPIACPALLVVAALMLAPRDAAADWTVTPFVGGNFGGAATVSAGASRDNTQNTFGRSVFYGVSVGHRITHALSVEADLARSPHAFATSKPSNAFQFTDDSSVTTLMGNVILTDPDPAVRPFVVGGLGLLHTDLRPLRNVSPGTASDLGMNVGGGVIGAIARRVALRGDARYFRSFRSTDYHGLALAKLHFWRVSSGVSITF